MNTEPELLNERLERLAMVLDEIMPNCALLVRDALELLKEQEPVEPVLDKQNGRIWLCGNCGCFVGLANYFEFDKFCRECGHPVKWQDEHLQRINFKETFNTSILIAMNKTNE